MAQRGLSISDEEDEEESMKVTADLALVSTFCSVPPSTTTSTFLTVEITNGVPYMKACPEL